MHTTKIIIASLALVLFVAALASLGGFSTDTARAGTGDNVSGWAWSDNIGWISFNGGNYGVRIDDAVGSPTFGAFSGYAWNDAIGWVSFNQTQTSGFPEGPQYGAKTDFTTGAVTGWARACSVLSSADCSGTTMKSNTVRGGWDGWIKMHNVSLGTPDVSGTRTFSGYAWGSDVVGWISMSGVSYGGTPVVVATPSVTLTAPASVAEGSNADIEWTVRDATGNCVGLDTNTADGTNNDWWAGGGALVDGNGGPNTISVGPITAPVEYTLTCGTASDSVTININPFIKFFKANGDEIGTSVFEGDSATLSWEVANADSTTDSCEINHSIGSASLPSGSTIVTPTTSTTYTLSCASSGISFDTESVVVNVIQSGFILEPEPQRISITSIGRDGVGTGGISNKALFWVRADANFSNNINLSVALNGDPFAADPGGGYAYKFRIVPTCEVAPGVYAQCVTATNPAEATQSGTLITPDGKFFSDGYGVEFWIESDVTLPARSENIIKIFGEERGGTATDYLTILLNSRLFDPEYREF